MEVGVHWLRLEALIEPFYLAPIGAMTRIPIMQRCLGYSDSTMKAALRDVPLLRVDAYEDVIPDESITQRFCHSLQKHHLAVVIFAKSKVVLLESAQSMKCDKIVSAE